MSHQDVVARAAELRRLLHDHNYRYHVLSAPIITDREYDALFQELKTLEATYPDLLTPDSPTQRVGSDLQEDLPKVQHDVPILSLSNAFGAEEVSFDFELQAEPEMTIAYPAEAAS